MQACKDLRGEPVPPALAAEGSTFAVDIRGRAAAAKVVKTPFYTRP